MTEPPWKLLNERDLRPRKALGQNFLIDPSTAEMIIRRSGARENDAVLEIGAGLGALTFPLSRTARVVYAIEKDQELAGILEGALRDEGIDNVRLRHQNIFDVALAEIAAFENQALRVFGNLPYYISSQVLIYLINARAVVRQADLMFQKEVAQRLLAGPGSKSYSRLSVMLQYYTEIRRTATVNAHLFWPAPKVDSEVLQFQFKGELQPVLKDHALFAGVIKAAFGRRRKTLRNALLSGNLNIRRADIEDIFEQCGIDPRKRAETLKVEQFVHLTNTICEYQANAPDSSV
jgi:16S rRNA (adenine1518-N6/adenine1519-N6)-dimethyltransferase